MPTQQQVVALQRNNIYLRQELARYQAELQASRNMHYSLNGFALGDIVTHRLTGQRAIVTHLGLSERTGTLQPGHPYAEVVSKGLEHGGTWLSYLTELQLAPPQPPTRDAERALLLALGHRAENHPAGSMFDWMGNDVEIARLLAVLEEMAPSPIQRAIRLGDEIIEAPRVNP